MVTMKKDAQKRLYAAAGTLLASDSSLVTLLGGTDEDERVYQDYFDLAAATRLTDEHFVSFGLARDEPFDVEQTSDIRDMLFVVHVWSRGPGADRADDIQIRVRELLADAQAALSDANFLVYFCIDKGYAKDFSTLPSFHHLYATFHIQAVAIE